MPSRIASDGKIVLDGVSRQYALIQCIIWQDYHSRVSLRQYRSMQHWSAHIDPGKTT